MRLILLIIFFATTLRAEIIKDLRGYEFDITESPKRVITNTPSITELIFALGSGDTIVASSRFCRFPEEAQRTEKIGGFIDLDYEKVVKLKPDLFILTNFTDYSISDKLTALNIKNFTLRKEGLDNLVADIRTLGKIFHKEENAEKLAKEIEAKVLFLNAKTAGQKKPRAILMFGNMAAGKGSYATQLLECAGAENCLANSIGKWPVPSKEFIITMNPDILILEMKKDDDENALINSYKKNPIWATTNAVKNDRIYTIDSDIISIPSSRVISALDALNEIVEKSKNN